MALTIQFDRKLSELVRRRTEWISRLLGNASQGRPVEFSRQKIRPIIWELESLARKAFIRRYAREQIEGATRFRRRWHPKKGKGRTRDKKWYAFLKWFDTRVAWKDCVYVYWAGDCCQYVGRTEVGRYRPATRIYKPWFSKTTQVDILAIRQRRLIPLVECLAIDWYKPIYNKIAAADRKYASKCPVCKRARWIRWDLEDLFRLRN